MRKTAGERTKMTHSAERLLQQRQGAERLHEDCSLQSGGRGTLAGLLLNIWKAFNVFWIFSDGRRLLHPPQRFNFHPD